MRRLGSPVLGREANGTRTEPARDPNLDFIRALAITLVMISHVPEKLFPLQGALGHGVDVFFVLSGFLIGRIFLKQEQRGFSLLRFWSDRWLRTLPAYYFVLLCGLLLGSFSVYGWPLSAFRGQLWQYLLFAQNYGFVSIQNPSCPFPLSWSLCVEEQFYLTLPLLFLLIRSTRGRALAMLAVVAVAFAARRVFGAQFDVWLFTTHFRFDAIALGVLASLLCNTRPEWVARLRPWSSPLIVAWLGLIALRCSIEHFTWDFLSLLNPATALVLVASAGAAPFPGSTTLWSRWGATMAYSLYLLHYQFYYTLAPLWFTSGLDARLPRSWMWPVVLACTFIGAWIVHVLAERPGLALRERVRRRLGATAPQPTPSVA